MHDNRRFHRVRFTAPCEVEHDGISYRGQLENVSLSGALVSFNEGVIVPQGERCRLSVHLEGEDKPVQIIVQVIHAGFSLIGMSFVSLDDETKMRLYRLMERVTTEPAKLRKELRQLSREHD